MKFKAPNLIKRTFAVVLAMAVIWSDASIASLAQTITPDDGTVQSGEMVTTESPSPEQTTVPEEDEEVVTPTEKPVEPTEKPAEPTEEPTEPTEEPAEPTEEPTEPVESESPVPSGEPLETPSLETPTPTATPAEMPPEMSVDLKQSSNGEERFVLRIDRTDTDDYNPESGTQIAADAMIYICEKGSTVMLDESSVDEIKWYKAVGDEEFDFDVDPCWTGACFPLDHECFLFESRLRAVIKVSGEQYGLDVNHIQPGTCAEGQGTLKGVLLPEHYIIIDGAEGDIFQGDSIFFRADDSNSANAEQISDGATINYRLTEEDNGKYIFAKYGAWNKTERKIDYYQTKMAGPIGYVVSEKEEDWQHNAQLLQSAIDEAEEIAAEENRRVQVHVPAGVKFKPAEGSIHFNNLICLYAYDAELYGGVVVTKAVEFAEDGDAGNVVGGIHGLHIVQEDGIAVDAAEAPVWLNDCSVSCSNGATMLRVSGDTYGKTAIYNCDVEFTFGGCILKLAKGKESMPEMFALANTNLRIRISDESTVTMVEYEVGATAGTVRWNVEGLEPQTKATIGQLSAPENSLINNAFWVENEKGMITNSGILTMQSVSKSWINPRLADGTTFAGNNSYKIIVGTPEEYEVCSIPGDIDYAFRPYAVTGQYGAGQGSYAKLLPAGFVTYVVIDVNQKDGFPYGALIGKKLENMGDNYVLMQYHADKSVETVASVIDGEVVQRGDSILEALLKEGDAYRVLVNTKVDGEPIEEPIVLAVYSELPSAKAGLKVFEEEELSDGQTLTELSDGQILTAGTKKVSFELNGGIARNYYDGDAFEINTGKCTVPEGSGMPAFKDDISGSRAVLEIPDGAYGTLVVTAHYKSSVSAKEVKFTYTLQLTSVQNAEGFTMDAQNAGGRYYGTATFDVLSGAARPLLSVSAGKGENGEGGYNFKVTSFTMSGSKVTVQYLLDSGGEKAWNDIQKYTPKMLAETVAGTYAIPLEITGAEASVVDEKRGITYLFDLENDNAVFTGAVINDGDKFYKKGIPTRIVVPDTVTVQDNGSEKTYSVKAMAEGCLNNIYQNGNREYAPDIVEIPASVTDIRGNLVTDPNYSNLRQIKIADDNTTYKTYGTAADFEGENRDDRQYCALYKVNGDHTELVEIASNYIGGLAWRSDAAWTDDTYSCNFSGITDFWCGDENDGNYQSWDRMLVKVNEEGATVIKAPEYEIGSSLILPEGIVKINAKALENAAITTLVLPSTMTEWEDGAVTQAKNIYVYHPDTTVNSCAGLSSSLKGITFYGFVDQKQSSALKSWVLAAKGQNYKFVAMKESAETAADYSVKTLRESVVSCRGIEYYPVYMGDELTETFDFDFSSRVVNGYPGKTDLTVELESGDDAEYILQEGEFNEDSREDGTRIFKAVKPGVAKVVIKKDDIVIKTAYFVVRPNRCDIDTAEGFWNMTFGETKRIGIKSYFGDEEQDKNVELELSQEVINEYDKIGAIGVLIPDDRAVTGTNGQYDAWQIELSGENGLAYQVTPLLYETESGEIKGGSETEIVLSLFGDSHPIGARAKVKGEEGAENKWLHVEEYNPLIPRGETIYIPVYWWSDEGKKNKTEPTPLDYLLTLNKALQMSDDGSSTYVEGDKTYQQAGCEVVSGSQFVTAEIVSGDGKGNNQDKAYLKIIGNSKKDGKAEIRIYMPWCEDYGDAYLTVSVGKDLVQRFALDLGFGDWQDTLDSTINQEDNPDHYVFDVNDEDAWKNNVITVSGINNTTGEEPYEALMSSKLNWTVSDASLAKLIKGDPADKNKVTGIQLMGEGTVLVTATVKDTNAASIRILFTVKNCKPRLHNDSAALDINDKHSVAEYVFAVPDGMDITDVQLASAEINKKPVENLNTFTVVQDEQDTHKVKVTAADPSKLAKGTGKLTLKITATERQEEGDNQEGAENQGEAANSYTYDYSVNLQLTYTQAKVTVTPENALDLGVLTGRETGLTVKVGDYSNSPSNTLTLDTTDTVTNNFSQYFTLEKEESENEEGSGRYVIKLVNDGGKTPAEIAKLFNGKKIKLTISSGDYAAIASNTTTVTLKITGTTPVLKPGNGGKITVDTSDVNAYKDGAYGSRLSYTLTEGFFMNEGTYGQEEVGRPLGTIQIAEKQAAYADKFTFNQSEGELEVMVDPGVPKGTYQFTWTAKVCAGEEDAVFGWQNLKAQKISVVVSGSKAKIALSTTKLTLNKNYLNTTADADFQFDEGQIRLIYGASGWFNGYAVAETEGSITLVKAPKGVTQENSKVSLWVEDNRVRAVVADENTVAGEYKYSITPYIRVGVGLDDGGKGEVLMALAPVTLGVQVTDTLPTASLDKTSVTLDNNDLSLRTLINLNVKGNYQWIDGGATTIEADKPGAPIVECWGNNTIAVRAGEDTLKGTYKITITPDVVLDSCPSNEGDGEQEGNTENTGDAENAGDTENTGENHRSLKPVILTVKVNSTRPTLKLAKTSLTAYSYYPGFESEEEPYAPAEARTDVAVSNGYAVRDIEVKPADAKTQTIQDTEGQAIYFSLGRDKHDEAENKNILYFDAIPTTGTPKGTYNYLVYAKTDGSENGVALEPVKLTVKVSSNKPDLKLSTNSVQILAGWQGNVNITLTDKAGCVDRVTEKTEYLIKKDNKWQICADSEAEAEAYAVLATSSDGSIAIQPGSRAASLTKAETVKAVAYEQEVYLKGNEVPYKAAYALEIKFAVTNPTAVVSAKTIAVNKNYDFGSQESNYLKLSLSNGAEITRYDIDDMSAGNKKDAIVLGDVEEVVGRSEIIFRAFPNDRSEASLEKGNYSFRITPYAENREGEEIELSSVTITIQVKEETPTVKADKTKVTINGLDTRGNTWQDVNISSNMAYVGDSLSYTVEITKGPKGVDLSEVDFFPRGREVDRGGILTIASTDTETPAGTYQVTVTPYTRTSASNGNSVVKLKAVTISVIVTVPKITASLQTAKMSIDVANPANIDMQNAIVLTGTNAELVNKIWWKGEGWKLTKKPKGAGENEIRIEDLQAGEGEDGHDGKSFRVRWANNYERWSDITPGTYEFTLTPAGIDSAEGVKINTPAPLKLTVTVKNSIPTIKYSKTSSKLNALFGTEDPVYFNLSDTSWNIEGVDAVMTAWPKGAGAEKTNLRFEYQGNRLMVKGSDKVPAGTYTFMLEAEAQKNGLKVPLKQQKFTVTVKNDIPTVKTSSSKLTLNTLYAGCYVFEDDPADNFNKSQQIRLTLAQNYGASHFEPGEFKISFTGKDNQRADAAKIEWRVYDDGTVAARLPWGSVVTKGSYSFEITPVLRSDETGAKITLKPVKVTVAAENKVLKASAKAGGKIDLLNREGSGITYQVTLSDKNLDAVREIILTGPEKGDDYSWKFELVQDRENHPGECIVKARAEDEFGNDVELSTSVNYEMRLEVHTECGKTYYVPVKIKPTQSTINLTADKKALTLFKQGSWDTAAAVQVKAAINNTQKGQLTIRSDEEGAFATGNKDFKAYEISNSPEEGCGIRLDFASDTARAKYKAGSKVKVPVYVQVYNQAVNTYTTSKIEITVTIKN